MKYINTLFLMVMMCSSFMVYTCNYKHLTSPHAQGIMSYISEDKVHMSPVQEAIEYGKFIDLVNVYTGSLNNKSKLEELHNKKIDHKIIQYIHWDVYSRIP